MTTVPTLVAIALCLLLCLHATAAEPATRPFDSYVLGYDTPVDAELQKKVEAIDASLREKFAMTTEQTAVGVLDLNTLRLALINPDRGEYAASVPKVGILLAYFQLHPEAATKVQGVKPATKPAS